MKTQIIAELGINHQGNIDLAKKMITEASQCGVDYIKGQKIYFHIKIHFLHKKSFSTCKFNFTHKLIFTITTQLGFKLCLSLFKLLYLLSCI